MTWSIAKGEYISPDFKMIDEILKKLNGTFDAYDLFHHSSSTEMFEFTYQKDNFKREAWQITFMGNCVASGGLCGLYYDDFYEDDYLFLIKENEDKIYNQAYTNAIENIAKILQYVSFSDIPKETKQDWIRIINEGIDKTEKDKEY